MLPPTLAVPARNKIEPPFPLAVLSLPPRTITLPVIPLDELPACREVVPSRNDSPFLVEMLPDAELIAFPDFKAIWPVLPLPETPVTNAMPPEA